MVKNVISNLIVSFVSENLVEMVQLDEMMNEIVS